MFDWRAWRNAKASSPRFQAWAARFPLTRYFARKDGERLFDLVSGFVYSQVLLALVEGGVLAALRDGPLPVSDIAKGAQLSTDRADMLCRAGVSLDVLERRGDGFGLSRLGAATLGAPGLTDMIRHHRVLYDDLSDPLALLRGEADPALARFWPYVFGDPDAISSGDAERYSDLMARSQIPVAEETLAAVSFSGVKQLMDVGGGGGTFLSAALHANPGMMGVLFDLPVVVADAAERLAAEGLSARAFVSAGSFREGDLPGGADAISLIRILFDHSDETVSALLARVFAALPPGGRVVISEPMTGGEAPNRSGDAYFAFYTMAMRTGRARSADTIRALLLGAGFENAATANTSRPFITSVVTAQKPMGR